MIKKEILRRIKLVVFDLDGTLVDDNDTIGNETQALIKELKNYNVKFSIATGRLLSAVTIHADALGINIPLITLDGTLIQRHIGDKSIYEAQLPKKYILRALKLVDQYLLKVALCHESAIYFTEENANIPSLLNKFGAKYQQILSYDDYIDGTLEVVIVGDYKENVKYVASKMSFPYTMGIRSAYYRSQSHGGLYYLEIRKMGCSKGEGFRRLIKHLKIKERETAVVGDWYNDRSLFDTDAIKVAVANAVPELKKMADIITNKTNNEDGVAEFLKILLQAKK